MIFRLLLVLGLVTGSVALAPAAQASEACWQSAWRCHQINAYRAEHGRAPLGQSVVLQRQAKAWAVQMAQTGVLSHSGNGTEIVGRSTDWASVMVAWHKSTCHDPLSTHPCPSHREILQDKSLRRLGIGVARSADGALWAVVRFSS